MVVAFMLYKTLRHKTGEGKNSIDCQEKQQQLMSGVSTLTNSTDPQRKRKDIHGYLMARFTRY